MIEIYHISKDKVKQAGIKELHKLKNEPVWLDITDLTKEERSLLEKEFNLHPLTAEDLYNQGIRIKVEEFNDYLFCVFYGIEKRQRVELMEIDFIIGDRFVITNHKGKIDTFEELKKDTDRLTDLFKKGPDFLFHRLLDLEVDNYFPILENIDDEIEKLEEEVAHRPRAELLQNILKLKRRITRIKKYTLPQREKTGFLTKNNYKHISKKALPYFRDVYDHTVRVADSVDNYREAVGNTYDVYMSAVSNNMNEVMKVLSIIATIALPLSVISGIYGTNFTTLPGAAYAHGFWAMLLGMGLLCFGMIGFFRRRGWF